LDKSDQNEARGCVDVEEEDPVLSCSRDEYEVENEAEDAQYRWGRERGKVEK
jgi:hypothetical protein